MIFWLPYSGKVSSQCFCAIQSHTIFPLSTWTFSFCLRHPQSCWNQCVVFIFESMLWFLNQLLPLSLSVSSVAQCLTHCDPMDCSPPGFCPSPIPGACSNSCPSSRWCHPSISTSVFPFSSCLQSSPASGSFPKRQFFASGGQSIAASASVFPMNIQDWFALGLTGWISLQSTGLSRVFSNTTVQKHRFFGIQPSSCANSHIHTWLLEKP